MACHAPALVTQPFPSSVLPFCLQEPSDYNPADIAMSLCRMISYNIGQLAYLNAKRCVTLGGWGNTL